MFSKLNSYRFSFNLPAPSGDQNFKLRFTKECFFRNCPKYLVSMYKPEFDGGLITLKVKKDKVTGYIKTKSVHSYDVISNLIPIICSSFPGLEFFSRTSPDLGEDSKERFFTGQNLRIHAPRGYWHKVLSEKADDDSTVTRLITVMKGFYLDECLHYNKMPSKQGLIEFHSSKRPYGNKDIPASIAFNLGWDWARVLTFDSEQLPSELEAETNRLHELVLEALKQEIN